MRRNLLINPMLLAGVAVLATAAGAGAATVTVANSKVSVDPLGLNANGINFGSGNVNGGFNVVTETNGSNKVEIGLRAQLRAPSPTGFVAPIGDSATYIVPTGETQKFGLNLGLWNYTYSVLLTGYSFTGPDALSANLTISDGHTTSGPIPLTAIPDNNTRGSTLLAPTATEIQNSENLAFPSVGFSGYDPMAHDAYTITLTVSGAALPGPVSNTIIATTAPEPATWAMMMLGFAGLGFAGFRARRATVAA